MKKERCADDDNATDDDGGHPPTPSSIEKRDEFAQCGLLLFAHEARLALQLGVGLSHEDLSPENGPIHGRPAVDQRDRAVD